MPIHRNSSRKVLGSKERICTAGLMQNNCAQKTVFTAFRHELHCMGSMTFDRTRRHPFWTPGFLDLISCATGTFDWQLDSQCTRTELDYTAIVGAWPVLEHVGCDNGACARVPKEAKLGAIRAMAGGRGCDWPWTSSKAKLGSCRVGLGRRARSARARSTAEAAEMACSSTAARRNVRSAPVATRFLPLPQRSWSCA